MWVGHRLAHAALFNDNTDSIAGELKVADGVQGTVMESIGRTWRRKGFFGFFSGNSAGRSACYSCTHAAF